MSVRFRRLLVTGGAGFIGSHFIQYGLDHFPEIDTIVNLDLLTYAGHKQNIKNFFNEERHFFVHGDIRNYALVKRVCEERAIQAIVHFAAETHVDRSIENPCSFLKTNVEGTMNLLEIAREFHPLHFHHISTDEVYGSLEKGFFNEQSPYFPNSPYSASKAASDHLVRAWHYTYGVPVTLSHCTNNYGPHQHAEKFIPRMILNSLKGGGLSLYGLGMNIRSWLYVEDHVRAIWMILNKGKVGEVYDIGGEAEMKNIDLLHMLIDLFVVKRSQNRDHLLKQIAFVRDRPGHDFRYAIDSQKIKKELGWSEQYSLIRGLNKTIEWYDRNN